MNIIECLSLKDRFIKLEEKFGLHDSLNLLENYSCYVQKGSIYFVKDIFDFYVNREELVVFELIDSDTNILYLSIEKHYLYFIDKFQVIGE